jgi:hypothetical protein
MARGRKGKKVSGTFLLQEWGEKKGVSPEKGT